MFNEYPKCLYLDGKVEAESCIVFDAQAEKHARELGYMSAGESQEKAKTKRNSKVK